MQGTSPLHIAVLGFLLTVSLHAYASHNVAVADTLTYDNFYDGIDWSFTASPSCPSTPGSYTRCGYSSNNRWGRISWNWPSCPLYPSLASTSGGYLYLQVPGNLQKKGAQIESLRADYWYGSYRVKIKAGAHSGSSSQGSVNGFFFLNSSKGEIDVEILGNEYPSKMIHYVTHPGGYEKICYAPADPSTSFIEYGFDWYKDKVVFFVNGVKCTNPQTSGVPAGQGSILLNHWTGNPTWGGTPPPSVSNMIVDYVWHTPFLLVTYPDSSGIVWSRGTSKTITWNRYGDVSSSPVTIELWKGGAVPYQTIRSGAPNTGSYTWVVPSSLPVASNYRIKVKSSDVDYYDFSNNDFRIQ